jgi:hypothetical protein
MQRTTMGVRKCHPSYDGYATRIQYNDRSYDDFEVLINRKVVHTSTAGILSQSTLVILLQGNALCLPKREMELIGIFQCRGFGCG